MYLSDLLASLVCITFIRDLFDPVLAQFRVDGIAPGNFPFFELRFGIKLTINFFSPRTINLYRSHSRHYVYMRIAVAFIMQSNVADQSMLFC